MEKMHTKSKLSIPLLIALVALPQISETIYTPALPSVARGLFTTPHMVELTLAIYFVGFAFGVMLWGTLCDILGRRSAMIAGLALYLLSTLACASASSIEALLLYRFAQAFGASVGSVVTQTILRDIFDGPERAQMFAVISGALAFAPAIGPILGGFISEYLGWRANFILLSMSACLLCMWVGKTLPETCPQGLKRMPLGLIGNLGYQMCRSKALWGHVLLIGATNAIIFGFYQEAPFVFISQMGLSPSYYGCFGVLIAVATLVAAKISYRQSRCVSAETMVYRGGLCVVAGGILLTFEILTGLYLENAGTALIVASLFVVFFGVGLIIPNSLSQALKPYQAAAGTAGSIFGGVYYGGIAICTWIMSLMHDDSPLPLALYILALGAVTLYGSKLSRAMLVDRVDRVDMVDMVDRVD